MGRGIISIANMVIIGIKRKRLTKYYQVLRSEEFKIEVDRDITWTLDGEEGIKGSAEVKNLHSHIKIFVPHKKDKPRSKYLK
jgi:diacylglycerol kinase family enzyme